MDDFCDVVFETNREFLVDLECICFSCFIIIDNLEFDFAFFVLLRISIKFVNSVLKLEVVGE